MNQSEWQDLKIKKPKLLLFRSIRMNLPQFILHHFVDQEECLRQDFTLQVISDVDCDLDELCDLHQPDLLMFESGVYAGARRIRNAHTHIDIPRIGFCNADAYCPTRSIFLSDMDRWGVGTLFTHAISMPSYTTEIADRLFLWPNFINPKRFSFQRRPKDTTVLLTGSRAPSYPWRNAISRVLSERYPVMSSPHQGWFDADAASGMVVGEAYIRQLSQAIFVPACGSIAREAVRKHFEIPAAGSCLIAEKTPALVAAGFIDMQNCLFADKSDVLDKVGYLLERRSELERIVQAGQELVQAKHTMRMRTQVADWLRLYKERTTGQQIVQRDPFGPLELTTDGALASHYFEARSEQTAVIRSALGDIDSNRLPAARAKFIRSNSWHFTAEAALGMALTYIRGGRPRLAIEWSWRIIDNELSMNGLEPDPVVWSTLIRALLCAGRVNEARRHARLAPWIRHHELDRIRGLVAYLSNLSPPQLVSGPERATVHPWENLGLEKWLNQIVGDLRRCGQSRLSKRAASMDAKNYLEDISAYCAADSDERLHSVPSELRKLRRTQILRLDTQAPRLSMRTSGPPARKVLPMLLRWAMKRLGVKMPTLVHESAALAETADYGQIVLYNAPTTSILVDAVFSGASRNPNLHFENPIAKSVVETIHGTKLFMIVGEGAGERLDPNVLIERAEVLVLRGGGQKREELISKLLASKRFMKLDTGVQTAGAILRRRATVV